MTWLIRIGAKLKKPVVPITKPLFSSCPSSDYSSETYMAYNSEH